MVLLIIIPMKNGYFIGKINPTFSGPNPFGMKTMAPLVGSSSMNRVIQPEGAPTGDPRTPGLEQVALLLK